MRITVQTLKKAYTANNKLKTVKLGKTDTSMRDTRQSLVWMLLGVSTHSEKSKKPIAKRGIAYRLNTKEAFKMVISNRSRMIKAKL